MQYIDRIRAFFTSERSKLKKSLTEFDSFIDEIPIPVTSDDGSREMTKLTKEQIAVNNRFPRPYETISDVYEKYDKLTDDWKPKSEIFALTYDTPLIVTANLISSIYITHRFRVAYKLKGNTALLNTFFPATVFPTFVSQLLFRFYVTLKLFRGNDECEMCDNAKAVVFQLSTALVSPIIVSAVTTTYFAHYFKTYPLPDALMDSKQMRKYAYDLIWKTIKRHRRSYMVIAVANIVFAYWLVEAQRKEFQFMYFKLLEKEFRKADNGNQKQINN